MRISLLNEFMRTGATALVCAFAVAGASEVVAAEDMDLGILPNGVPVEYPANKGVVTATFTVPEDGPVRVLCTGTFLHAFTTPEHETEYPNEFSYVDGGSMREYNCKKGDIMYFFNGFVMDPGTITVTSGKMDVKLINTYPSANADSPDYYGGEYSISRNHVVSFFFNIPIQVQGARMSINNSAPLGLTPDVGVTTVELDIASNLMQAYKNGTLKKGDTVKLELVGVQERGNSENLLGGNGIASVEFKMCGQPIELLSTTNTPDSGMTDLLSYYVPGNPSSIVTFTFSGDIDGGAKAPTATLTYGDLDNIEAGMYIEQLPETVDGATLKIDLAGKLRRPADMLPALTNPTDYIDMEVKAVRGLDGQLVYINSSSAPHSYGYRYKIKVIQYSIASDFTPAATKPLVEGEDLEIFIMDGEMLSFDGVKFAYTVNGKPVNVVVDKANINIEKEGPSDLVLTLKVPTLPDIDADSSVTVTLNNLSCDDGFDHESDVTAVYNTFTSGLLSVYDAQDSSSDIYNAQGILVMKGAKASDLHRLPAGLYIMNGRKVVVR